MPYTAEEIKVIAIEGRLLKQANDNIGIYVQSVSGPNGYEKRTEKMEGWNDCAIALDERWVKLDKWYKALPDVVRPTVGDLLLADHIELIINGDAVEMTVNCNDLFYWACSDCEELTANELDQLQQCLTISPTRGRELWCCRKRRMRPQGAYYRYIDEKEWPLFDACGPERTDPDGRR